MDLANDILRLAEKVVQVPGLSVACSLAMQIMKTVQISKNNTARLQYLAHSVANYLITIAEHMEGNWDGATDNLKSQLDGFDVVLQDIHKLVTKYSKSSPVVAFINAGDRDMAIQRLERRLVDSRISVLVLLGVDTSVGLHTIHTSVDRLSLLTHSQLKIIGEGVDQVKVSLRSQGSRDEDTHSRVIRIENLLQGHTTQTTHQKLSDNEIPLYSRHELRLLRTLSRGHTPSRKHVTVTLTEAQHRTTGQVVLVKSYEGFDLSRRTETFSRDLLCHANVWEPTILQLIGASTPTLSIPFQVYDAPGGQVVDFRDWLSCTVAANPAEAICGLYDMRASLKVCLSLPGMWTSERRTAQALLEFQRGQNVTCALPLYYSVVNVQVNRKRMDLKLIFTGEISDGHDVLSTIHDQYFWMLPWETPGETLVNAFCEGSRTWADGARGLDALFDCGIPDLDIAALGSILVENGWLGATSEFIYSMGEARAVGLGDVGYRVDNGCFVVISNLHTLLAASGGGSLMWTVGSCGFPNLSQEDVVVVQCSGRAYRRYKSRNQSWASTSNTLEYVNLDERQAWKVLREHACEIVANHALAVSPHNLELVICVVQGCSFEATYQQDSKGRAVDSDGDMIIDKAGNMAKTQSPPAETYSEPSRNGNHWHSSEQGRIRDSNNTETQSDLEPAPVGRYPSRPRDIVDQYPSPQFYIFESNGLHIRDLGVPELSSWGRASFQEEPEWLVNDGFASLESRGVETKEGCKLIESRKYLKLPLGVALPYVEDLGNY